MKRFLYLILALFLLPLYPLLRKKAAGSLNAKISLGEKIVVVTTRPGKRKIIFQ